MWQLDDPDGVLFGWLAEEPEQENRHRMLEWIAELSRDPKGIGWRVPGERAPVYLGLPPVPNVVLKYLVADPFQTIKLIKIERLL